MWKALRIALLVAGLFDPSTGVFAAEEFRMVELATPWPLARGEAVQLQVTAGPLPRGARLTVMTEQGEILGAVAPFGPALVRGSTAASVPVPRSAIADGRVRLRLQVLEPNGQSRPPRPDEIERLDLVPVPQVE